MGSSKDTEKILKATCREKDGKGLTIRLSGLSRVIEDAGSLWNNYSNC